MNPLRLVSITHPGLGGAAGNIRLDNIRLDLLPSMAVTILGSLEHTGSSDAAGTVRRVSLPSCGRARRMRFPSLAASLAILDPDVVHLHADPDTSLALQVASLCAASGCGLVLEADMSPARGWIASMRARRTLSCTNAVIARTASGLASLRRLGFEGFGLIAGRGSEPQPLPDRDGARRLLRITPAPQRVIGWTGPLDTRSHVADLLEAAALCQDDVVVVVPAGPLEQEVLDRADALEILHRVRFAVPERLGADAAQWPDLSAFATMLAAIDALLVAPPRSTRDRACALRAIEIAHTHAIPVIHPELPDMAEMVGAGGWQVPSGDPVMLARLFDHLRLRPSLLEAATAAASAIALSRHSPMAAATELARAATAASLASIAGASRRTGKRAWNALALHRQPGGT